MGDRAQVEIISSDNDSSIFLYTHWGGSEIVDDVRRALAKKWRWNDPSYLTRIIFDELVGLGCHGEETGFGIRTGGAGDAHTTVVVNCDKKTVLVNGSGHSKSEKTFEEFIGEG